MNWFEKLLAAVKGDAEAEGLVRASSRVPDPSRRRFLKTALLGAAVAATVDVDQLLWTPGQQTILTPDEWYAQIHDEAWTALDKQLGISIRMMRNWDEAIPIGGVIEVRLPQRYITRVDVLYGIGHRTYDLVPVAVSPDSFSVVEA